MGLAVEGIKQLFYQTPYNLANIWFWGSGKGVFWKRGLFRKVHDSREFRDSRDSREPPNCGKKGESDHFLEILVNLEILEIPPVKKTPFVMTPLSGPDG